MLDDFLMWDLLMLHTCDLYNGFGQGSCDGMGVLLVSDHQPGAPNLQSQKDDDGLAS